MLMDRVWVWGGPTPHWGGTMDKDIAAKGAQYFGAANVAYVYGANNEEMMDTLASFKRVSCPLSRHCRSVEVSDEVTEARVLSELSLSYPNIVGAIIDDLSISQNFPRIAPKMKDIWSALHQANPKLNLYGVVYTRDLDADFGPILPYLDGVNLWVWNPEELQGMESAVQKTKEVFQGKPILMGLFIHNYFVDGHGLAEAPVPMDLIKFQFETAGRLLAEEAIEGIVILGAREIAKHPAEAEWIRDFLKSEFMS